MQRCIIFPKYFMAIVPHKPSLGQMVCCMYPPCKREYVVHIPKMTLSSDIALLLPLPITQHGQTAWMSLVSYGASKVHKKMSKSAKSLL
jgi:hypothetical protein